MQLKNGKPENIVYGASCRYNNIAGSNCIIVIVKALDPVSHYTLNYVSPVNEMGNDKYEFSLTAHYSTFGVQQFLDYLPDFCIFWAVNTTTYVAPSLNTCM